MSRLARAREAISSLDELAEACLEPEFVELIRLRVSQLNGCAYCLDMHTKDLLALGVDPQHHDLLPGWRKAPGYTERERAGLDWAEQLTLKPARTAGVRSESALAEIFTHDERFALAALVIATNAWNRLAIALDAPAGNYRSRYDRGGDRRSAETGR
jgi:AhpD family alkylhydroperoxidase